MKVIITESQFMNLIQLETTVDKTKNNTQKKSTSIDTHTLMTILSIGTAFIPVAGPFISASIGLADAALYYKEGDKNAAGLTSMFSMLPFIKYVPGAKKLGSKAMAILANKLIKGETNLSKAESEIIRSVKSFTPEIQKELTKMAPKLKSVVNELDMYKQNYVKKYGENEYNILLSKFLYGGIDKKIFVNTLKNVKSPNIKIKPVLGGGRDHRIFQSSIYPDRVFKAEVRSGEIDKWYDLFKKNQNIFVKTFNKIKIKDKDGTILSAVVMEKLDTTPFHKMWNSMEMSLSKMPTNNMKYKLEYVAKHIKEPEIKKIWVNLLKYIKEHDPSISSKVNEFYDMVNKLYNITPKPDIRQFNFGYDKNGVLKSLDI